MLFRYSYNIASYVRNWPGLMTASYKTNAFRIFVTGSNGVISATIKVAMKLCII